MGKLNSLSYSRSDSQNCREAKNFRPNSRLYGESGKGPLSRPTLSFFSLVKCSLGVFLAGEYLLSSSVSSLLSARQNCLADLVLFKGTAHLDPLLSAGFGA